MLDQLWQRIYKPQALKSQQPHAPIYHTYSLSRTLVFRLPSVIENSRIGKLEGSYRDLLG